MGMTIEEAIATIKGEKWIGCQEKYIEAINLMENTMRKYQKIQEIVKQKDYDRFNSHNYYGYFLRVQDIRKVLENGNVD